MHAPIKLAKCKKTIDADQNTLDMTAWREDGHRFLTQTAYNDDMKSVRCLTCGLNALMTWRGDVVEIWN